MGEVTMSDVVRLEEVKCRTPVVF